MICRECFEPVSGQDDIIRHAHLHQVGTDGLAGAQWPSTASIESPEDGDLASHDGGSTWFVVGQAARRPVIVVEEGHSRKAALRAYTEVAQFWPAAWIISDHGNEEPFNYRS